LTKNTISLFLFLLNDSIAQISPAFIIFLLNAANYPIKHFGSVGSQASSDILVTRTKVPISTKPQRREVIFSLADLNFSRYISVLLFQHQHLLFPQKHTTKSFSNTKEIDQISRISNLDSRQPRTPQPRHPNISPASHRHTTSKSPRQKEANHLNNLSHFKSSTKRHTTAKMTNKYDAGAPPAYGTQSPPPHSDAGPASPYPPQQAHLQQQSLPPQSSDYYGASPYASPHPQYNSPYPPQNGQYGAPPPNQQYGYGNYGEPQQGGGYYPPGPPMGYQQQGGMAYGQQGGYYGRPQGQYVQQQQSGSSGMMEALLASLACCCCLDACLLF